MQAIKTKYISPKCSKRTKKPKLGRERLIEENGKCYWLQSDGSKRETTWILRNGLAVLTTKGKK